MNQLTEMLLSKVCFDVYLSLLFPTRPQVQHLERFANLTCSREEQLELRVRFRLYQLMNSAESTSSKYTRALHLATNIPVEKIDTVRESRWLEENVLCIPPSAQAVISSNYLTQDKPSFSCTSNSAAY